MAEQTAAQQSLTGVPPPPEKKTRAEMTRVHDRELKAMERIVRELSTLRVEAEEEGAEQRVIRYLAERYGFIVSRGNDE